MESKLIKYLIKPSAKIKNVVDRRRARMLSAMLIPLMIVTPVGSLASTIEAERITVAILFFIAVIAYAFSRTRLFYIAGVVITMAIFMPPYAIIFSLKSLTSFR